MGPRWGGSMAMDPEQDGPGAPLSLAAARAMFRAPQASNVCWADVELPDGSVRACGRPEATSLGLCPEGEAGEPPLAEASGLAGISVRVPPVIPWDVHRNVT